MPKDKEESFVDLGRLSVIIPYSDLEKIVSMAKYVEVIEKRYARIEAECVAMRLMFSECLDKIGEIRDYVSD